MNRTYTRLAVAISLAMILCAPAASTQTISPFKSAQLAVPLEDMKKMQGAARPLYLADPAEIGSAGKWSNEATGNFGTVELVAIFEWHDYDCRKLRHIVKIDGVRDPVMLIVDRCRTPEGDWKVRY